MLIAFAGQAGSGKDFSARLLEKLLQPKYVKHYKLADPLKRFCETVFDWTSDHTEGDLKSRPMAPLGKTPREAMQLLGTEWGRRIDPDCWVKMCLRRIYRDMYSARPVALENSSVSSHRIERVQIATITDIRFANEAKAVLDWGGYLIYLEGGGLQGKAATHPSETALADVKPLCDVVIDNSARDPGELERALQGFLDGLEKVLPESNADGLVKAAGLEWKSW